MTTKTIARKPAAKKPSKTKPANDVVENPVTYVPRRDLAHMANRVDNIRERVRFLLEREIERFKSGSQNIEFTLDRVEEIEVIRASLLELYILCSEECEDTFVGWDSEAEARAGKLARAPMAAES